MIVYNTTIKVDLMIEAEWLSWQKKEQLPEIMKSDCFTHYKFYKLLGTYDEQSSTYVIQLFAATAAHLDAYLKNFAPLLKRKAISKWGDQFVAFTTTMQVVN
jgi:hypothetical protein